MVMCELMKCDNVETSQMPIFMCGAVLVQIFFQYKYFIPDPIKNDVQYQARAQPFLVFGLLTTGLAIGQSNALLP